ncbi:MAG: GLUG motif-containing protein [Bacteroidales bacterium]
MYRFNFFILAMLFSAGSLMAQTASKPEGSGTSDDPYQIVLLENLSWLSQTSSAWGSYFIQTADIDAADTKNWNDGEGFSPIGNSTTKFTGNYNGQDHTINNIYINRSSIENLGFFGFTLGAVVKNIGITNATINGLNKVGILIGSASGSTISDCFTTGTANATGYDLGGFVGKVSNTSTISNCYNAAKVTGSNNASGGLAGACYSSSVANCYNSGIIIANQSGACYIGGLIGKSSTVTVENCYNIGNVIGADTTGGFIGWNCTGSSVTNSYSTGYVTGTKTSSGAFIGINEASTISGSYWTPETAKMSNGLGQDDNNQTVTALSTVVLRLKSCLSSWDFSNTWGIRENNTYPALLSINNAPNAFTDTVFLTGFSCNLDTILRNNDFDYETAQAALVYRIDSLYNGNVTNGVYTMTTINDSLYYTVGEVITEGDTLWGNQAKVYITHVKFDGEGTANNPYIIQSLEDLKALSETNLYWGYGYYFKQTADINAADTKNWNNDEGFSPIGREEKPFVGHYNGSGHFINNLYINRPTTDNVGLFGYIKKGSELDSLNVAADSVIGNYNVGILVGINYSPIKYSSTSGVVYGDSSNVGGCIGYNLAQVSYCSSSANVTGNGKKTGGLVGSSFATGFITNCYSRGTVKGADAVGGLVGTISIAKITNCYAADTLILTSGSTSGGLNYMGMANNSFYNIDIYPGETTHGTGLTTEQMRSYNTFADAGWDLIGESANGTDDRWAFSSVDNDGFPCFVNQITGPVIVTGTLSHGTQTTATCNASIKYAGTSPVTAHGFCWSTTNSLPTLADSSLDLGAVSDTGHYSVTIGNLIKHTTYYARAYATNSAGTSYGAVVSFTIKYSGGTGTSIDPFYITSLSDLKWLSENSKDWNCGYYFIQAADIDADSTKFWNNNKGFLSIGNDSIKFMGHYNGAGHAITGLYINNDTAMHVGLFGYINKSSVDSLNLIETNIAGSYYVAGISSWCDSTSISNCSMTGNISGVLKDNNGFVGGIVGINYIGSNITNCIAKGTISGYRVGGIAGYNYTSVITNCNMTGNVIGSEKTGGIVGSNNFYSEVTNCNMQGSVSGSSKYTGGISGFNYSSITNCKTTGNVSGTTYVGGIVGCSQGNTIKNCVALANITGTSLYIGGFVGFNWSTDISNSSASGDVLGASNYCGGFVGRNDKTATITNCYATGNVTGKSEVGGFSGENYSSSITNCYATGNVSGTLDIGGFTGGSYNGPISSCYSTGSVSGTSYTAGFIGSINSLATISNCYWNTQTSGKSEGYILNSGTIDNLTGLTTAQMKESANFAWGIDTSSVWSIRTDSTYPAFKNIDNAPFAFTDSVSTSASLASLFNNDFDFESIQKNLVKKIDTIYSLKNKIGYNSLAEADVKDSLQIIYRVGERRITEGDTLWGNRTTAIVRFANQAPVCINKDTLTNEDTALKLPFSAFATDPDNDTLLCTIPTPPVNGIVYIRNDSLLYIPNLNFNGNDSIQIAVGDGQYSDTLWVYVTVNPANDAPILSDVALGLTIDEDAYISLNMNNVTASDVDNDALSLMVISGNNYTVDGTTISPNANFNGTLTVPVAVTDGLLNSDTLQMIITVNAVNDAPILTAVASGLNFDEDASISLSLDNITASDVDNDALSLMVISGNNYTVDGTTISPDANFNGTLTVPVAVTDGLLNSDTLQMVITVNAVNDAPILTAVASGLNFDEDASISLSINNVTASDVDNDALSLMVISGNNYTVDGTTISPDADFNGILTVPVAVTDGLLNSDTLQMVITLNAVNDAPVITSKAETTATVGKEYTYAVVATDVDDDVLSYTLSNAPEGMELTNAVISWTPANGTSTSGEVTLTVSDGSLIATETFTISVSEDTGINKGKNESLFLYPNPTSDNFRVKGFEGSAKLYIYSINGMFERTQTVSEDETIDVSGLTTGTHLVKIVTGNGTICKMLLKQ